MEVVLETMLGWFTSLWTWLVYLNGALQIVLVLLCVVASGACAVVGRRMNAPTMDASGSGAGRTVVAVVAWIAGALLMLVALLGIAAVFAPLLGLA